MNWYEITMKLFKPLKDKITYNNCNEKPKQGTRVVHVGRAWTRAEREVGGVMLYADDLEHPAPDGTSLAAACVFSSLWGT